MTAINASVLLKKTIYDTWLSYMGLKKTNANYYPFSFSGDNYLLKGNIPSQRSTENITVKKYTALANSSTSMIKVCRKIEKELELCGVSENKNQNFSIALTEAINNAQEHGYSFAKNKKVSIHFYNISDKYYLARIVNKGNPINIARIRELLLQNEPLQKGIKRGRGFLLMMKTVDILFISSNPAQTEVFLGIEADSEQ